MTTTFPLTIDLPSVPPERDQLLIERARQASIAQRLVRLREQVDAQAEQIAALQRQRQIAMTAVEATATARRGGPPSSSVSSSLDPDRLLTFSDGSPVGPAERDECARLGGASRYEQLRAIAEARGWNLNLPGDRDTAEALLFREATIGGATSLVECVHALARSRGLTMAELRRDGSLYADLVLSVRSLRPDIVGDPRSGRASAALQFAEKPTRADVQAKLDGLVATFMDRHDLDPEDGKDRAEAMQTVAARNPQLMNALYDAESSDAPPSPEATRAKRFAEAVDQLIREQGVPRTDDNVARASRAIRKRHPELMQPAGRGRV